MSGSPYGDTIPCRDDCLCKCHQPGCACRETPTPFVPNRAPEKRTTTP